MQEIDRLQVRIDKIRPVLDKLSIEQVDSFSNVGTVLDLAKRFANFVKPTGEIDLVGDNNLLIVGYKSHSGSKYIGIGDYINNTHPSNPLLTVVGRKSGDEKIQTISITFLEIVCWEISPLR